jgi:hypothetical protein
MAALEPDAIANVISLSTLRAHHPTWTRLRNEALQLPRSGPYSDRDAQQEDARAFPRIQVATGIPVALKRMPTHAPFFCRTPLHCSRRSRFQRQDHSFEEMLFAAGALERRGTVREGNTSGTLRPRAQER